MFFFLLTNSNFAVGSCGAESKKHDFVCTAMGIMKEIAMCVRVFLKYYDI